MGKKEINLHKYAYVTRKSCMMVEMSERKYRFIMMGKVKAETTAANCSPFARVPTATPLPLFPHPRRGKKKKGGEQKKQQEKNENEHSNCKSGTPTLTLGKLQKHRGLFYTARIFQEILSGYHAARIIHTRFLLSFLESNAIGFSKGMQRPRKGGKIKNNKKKDNNTGFEGNSCSRL